MLLNISLPPSTDIRIVTPVICELMYKEIEITQKVSNSIQTTRKYKRNLKTKKITDTAVCGVG